ncbi:response regulator [Fluviispira multicolorata]|uniref:Response regulator n=1 Tax=Fluviispira multicolorata TaxID=2654512 RepID=A0A833N5W2_9BACT|nr:response regulator [Fluviispira multicolorata]KAB8031794.1 response regulator [Fluviispira multicolorata]
MSGKTILIVDDAVETRLFLKGIVNSLAFTPVEAKSGIDALKILGDQKIDLVILDVLMPNLDGYQTLEFINQLKKTQNIKVIFFSGKKGELDQTKINELKPDDFIHKTVDIQVLKTKIKKLINAEESQATKPMAPPAMQPPQAAPKQATPSAAPQPPIATSKPPPTAVPPAVAAKPAAGAAAKPISPQTPATGAKLELNATITNMPIVLDIIITQLTPSGIVFQSKFQFKEGAQLSINCPQAATTLKKAGELQTKVQKCVQDGENYIVNTSFA